MFICGLVKFLDIQNLFATQKWKLKEIFETVNQYYGFFCRKEVYNFVGLHILLKNASFTEINYKLT